MKAEVSEFNVRICAIETKLEIVDVLKNKFVDSRLARLELSSTESSHDINMYAAEIQDRISRSCNLLIYGCPEAQNPSQAVSIDKQMVIDILKKVNNKCE